MNLKLLLTLGAVLILAAVGTIFWVSSEKTAEPARPAPIATARPADPAVPDLASTPSTDRASADRASADPKSTAPAEEVLPEFQVSDPAVASWTAETSQKEVDGSVASALLLAGLEPITGGNPAFESKHRNASSEDRTKRRETIMAALTSLDGEPEGERELVMYGQLKDELYWLKDHP